MFKVLRKSHKTSSDRKQVEPWWTMRKHQTLEVMNRHRLETANIITTTIKIFKASGIENVQSSSIKECLKNQEPNKLFYGTFCVFFAEIMSNFIHLVMLNCDNNVIRQALH